MRTEERTVFLACLIPIVFGGIMYLEKGMFILPFPLNEIIFAIVAFYFAFKHYKFYTNQALFSSAFAFFNLLSTEFFWSLFLKPEQMQNMFESGSIDLIRLLASVLLIIWGGISLVRGDDKIRSIVFLIFFVLYAGGLIFENYPIVILATLVPFIASFRYRDLYPFHLLWLLYSILSLMKFSMLLFS
jgi:ABC-type multidrug transport system fused ATPase/permease subunit